MYNAEFEGKRSNRASAPEIIITVFVKGNNYKVDNFNECDRPRVPYGGGYSNNLSPLLHF